MAAELRWELMRSVVADGTTSASADAEFRNDSNGMLHIRHLDIDADLTTAAANEGALVEVSKAPVLQSETNNSPFFATPLAVRCPPNTSTTPVDGSMQRSKVLRFARGQLVLEPNESVFINVTKTSGGAVITRVNLGYEF